MSVGLLLLAAHLLGDFPFQPTWMARRKLDEPSIRMLHVNIHMVIVVLFVFFAGVDVSNPILFFICYGATHYIIDSRRWVKPRDDFPTWQYIVDQTLHVTAIAWVAVLFV